MSIEIYPTLEALDEKLATLEDPILSERLVIENPALFPSAAAQEEISVFASAWKRFGNLALALTAAASIAAGYVLAPIAFKQASPPSPVPVPVPVHKAAPSTRHAAVKHSDAALRAALKKQQAEIARLRAQLEARRARPAQAVAVPAVVHHVAPVAHKAQAPAPNRAAAPASRIDSNPQSAQLPQSQVEGAAGPQAAPKSQVDTSTGSAPTTDTQVGTPDGTKNPPQPPPTTGRGGIWGNHFPVGIGGVILGRTVDPCTPSGGRVGTVLQSIAGQVLTRAASGRF